MGQPVQLRIFTRDPRRAATFYAEVFGWSLPADEDRLCWIVTPSDDHRLGIDSTHPFDADADRLSIPTLHVDDLGATAQAAIAAGGEILVPRIPVPGMGWLAYLADPDGNLLGIMQDDPRARSAEPTGPRHEGSSIHRNQPGT